MKKRDLIYGAASEAVMEARIKIQRSYSGQANVDRNLDRVLREIDVILLRAQQGAGTYALRAYDADARKVNSVGQLLTALPGRRRK